MKAHSNLPKPSIKQILLCLINCSQTLIVNEVPKRKARSKACK